MLICWGVAGPTMAQQWSEDPSDATTSLTSNALVPAPLLTPAMPSICGGTSLNGPFSFGSVSTTTAQSANLAHPPCQVNQNIVTPTPPKDIWFRMDPAFTDAVYRFTLYGTGTPSTASAGMAVYEAPNATGPMRLLGCATGGAYDNAFNPSVEATCITPGNKIYVRVWPRGSTASNANFNLCVMGQRISTMPDRGADETACTARILPAVGSFTTSGSFVNYVFACEEPDFLLANDNNMGGDLWVKMQVPTTGHVRLRLSYSTSSTNQIGSGSPVSGSLGISAYLSPDCSDPLQFRQVGGTVDQVTPATAGQPIDIRCLPPGEWLYVRIHSLKGSMNMKKRYGQFRLEWMAGPGSYVGYTPPANTQPCGATSLTVGETCTGTTAGTTYDMCAAPGIPAPTCGGFIGGSQQSSWYKFTAPNSGMVQIDAQAGAAPATQPAIALYASNAMAGDPGEGCNMRLSLIACDDRSGTGSDARIIQGALIPGQVYYVRVWARKTVSSTAPEGNFTICITNPTPPAGTCWYMIDLWAYNTTGTLAMEVTIPPGPTVTYTTSGGDPSESFLIALPIGSTVNFHRVPAGGGVGTSGYVFHALWQVGSSDTIWWDDGGYAVAGPTSGPNDHFVLTDACSPRPNPRTDCFGMRTICLDATGAYHTVTGQMDNTPWPISSYSPAAAEYQGYTFHPYNGGMMDLAGANMGCLDGEAGGIQWMVFRPEADGTVAFLLEGYKVSPAPTAQADIDFAIWDLGIPSYNLPPDPNHIDGYDVCPPQSPPIRCSSARNQATTGLAQGMMATQEGHGGWGWLAPLPVLAGHAYLIAMVPANVTGRINYSLNWTMFTNTSGVSDPTIIGCEPLVLPVELLFLQGVPRGGAVDLTWATATEKNSSHFMVEHSADAEHFTAIGKVQASGNTQYRTDYGFTDEEPFTGVNYYRLRQVDKDGTWEYSNTVVVITDMQGGQVMVFPNPVEDVLRLALTAPAAGTARLQVLDALGRTVRERSMAVAYGQNLLEVDVQGLHTGTYMVRLVNDGGVPLGSARFVVKG
ncbi:MAG TPA: T9SS type A sorting domain-containing protein [Flavobacteriales bacterium]|nr:T9SS type A sorting domain-containing protein [Flavobacteriales bacterium]